MAAELTLDAVSYRYPNADRDALHGVSTEFEPGVSAVLGATGAGKSTLLAALCGVVPALSGGELRGRVSYGRANLADYRVATITQYIGLVLQDPASQIIGRTVAEDVSFGPRNHQVPAADIPARVTEALGRVGLSGFEERATSELSGGELQRLAIAGVLAMAPEVLCLDEATAELDPQGAAEVRGVLSELCAEGLSIVMATHDPQVVLSRAQHLVVLDEGQAAWQGAPADFYRDPRLATELGVRPAPIAEFAAQLVELRGGLAPSSGLPLNVSEATEWLRPLVDGLSAPVISGFSEQPTGGEPAIQIEGLRFSYPGRPEALQGIDLMIECGEFVALMGANGAGKTTLAKHLNGLLRPSAGRVLVDGRDIAAIPTWQLASEVGFVFQNPDHQLFCGTVRAEVGYGLKQAGLAAAEIDRRVDEVLSFTGLLEMADQNPLTLPRGQRQLVAMASTLVARPPVLVVDEPTTGQDWPGELAIMGLLDRLHEQGTTIVMISHDQELVARHATRVVGLSGGLVTSDGPTANQVSTQLGQLWHGLFGADALAPRGAEQAARLLAAQLRGRDGR